MPVYSLTKLALNGLTVKLARQLAHTNIKVNAVCPGFVATYPGTAALGARPVRGFAVTMGLGIVISMFTAVSVVRLVMVMWVGGRPAPRPLRIRPLLGRDLIPRHTAFRFMRARFLGLGLSAVLSLGSLALLQA